MQSRLPERRSSRHMDERDLGHQTETDSLSGRVKTSKSSIQPN